ncbi:TetR/AcrR family transcriptional regulator [Parvibaculum sp.]|uniref:TetR/AcrR family transcriptional regulator n=1 Tax=Parvibaculum sp. TaxID=2024848 RepID=UPI000C955CC3|nr:TetR/AcrR family transcriptional regulator [Parvibaculum sp.]MAB12321.1 TetR family transcriptional regulator [Parvibaculum sp.]
MARRTGAKGQRRIEEILDAAEEILVEAGYGGLSMRGVADRLGLRLSHVQYYFDGPDALLEAIFDRSLTRSIEVFETRPKREGIEAMVAFVLEDQLSASNCRMFFELWALAARDDKANAVLARYYARYQSYVESIVASEYPQAKPAQLKRCAVILMSLFEGLSLFRGVEGRIAVSRRELDKDIVKAVRAIVEQS